MKSNKMPFLDNDNMDETLLIDDNNSHDGKGLKYAVIKRNDTSWSVLEVDEGFRSEDKLLLGMVEKFFVAVHGLALNA